MNIFNRKGKKKKVVKTEEVELTVELFNELMVGKIDKYGKLVLKRDGFLTEQSDLEKKLQETKEQIAALKKVRKALKASIKAKKTGASEVDAYLAEERESADELVDSFTSPGKSYVNLPVNRKK